MVEQRATKTTEWTNEEGRSSLVTGRQTACDPKEKVSDVRFHNKSGNVPLNKESSFSLCQRAIVSNWTWISSKLPFSFSTKVGALNKESSTPFSVGIHIF